MSFEIRNRFTGAVIYRSETASTVAEAVREVLAQDPRANLAGANLANANLADADLADAYLANAYLADADLAGADLAGADLAGAYLANAYLADAYLADADLAGADLAGADLAGAYLAQARGLPIGRFTPDPTEPYVCKSSAEVRAARAKRYRERHPDVPVVEHLDRKILDAITSGGGTLEMGAWHTCETTHCRAGWAVHLAGPAGYALEQRFEESHGRGAELAGRAIYLASTGRAPHFYADNEAALEDIKRCAAEQAEGAS